MTDRQTADAAARRWIDGYVRAWNSNDETDIRALQPGQRGDLVLSAPRAEAAAALGLLAPLVAPTTSS